MDPQQWQVVFEDKLYLHLVENKPGGDMKEIRILDKKQNKSCADQSKQDLEN